METQTKLTLAEIAEYFEKHLDSQYYEYEVKSISDIEFVNGFTVATVTYTTSATVTLHSDKLVVHSRRWSYRREDWDNRIVSYYHDETVHPSI